MSQSIILLRLIQNKVEALTHARDTYFCHQLLFNDVCIVG